MTEENEQANNQPSIYDTIEEDVELIPIDQIWEAPDWLLLADWDSIVTAAALGLSRHRDIDQTSTHVFDSMPMAEIMEHLDRAAWRLNQLITVIGIPADNGAEVEYALAWIAGFQQNIERFAATGEMPTIPLLPPSHGTVSPHYETNQLKLAAGRKRNQK